MHPFLRPLASTVAIAHRGGAALAPENTLAAFRQAVEDYGAGMLETDLQVSADGALVVFHDSTLERCTDGSGPVSALPLEALRKLDAGYRFSPRGSGAYPFRGRGLRIPTLRELLDAFPKLPLHIDLKDGSPGLEEALARELEGEEERVCVGSADDRVAARIREALPSFCLFAPKGALQRWVLAAKAGLRPQRDERWQVLSLPWRFGGLRVVSERLLRVAAAEGKWVNAWTVDDPGEMRRLLELGIGGIMTDRPDLLQPLVSKREHRRG